ncbi:putative sugar kinase [Austwickia chelonae NBRC 105200]|uniref:Putative sugar kinase n=1 Tax=Austwickia chelonae NBRC 105200 TaxID=1184607 RepID=K6VRG1_9MICO|nr:putative sugar kinase [Austwickia chelonae NBRC 105200]
MATPTRRGGDAVVAQTLRLIEQARSTAPRDHRTVAVGIGSEGVIDRSGQVVSAPAHFTGYAGTALTARITAAAHLPVHAATDVHAYALGEAWRGAAAGANTAIFIGVGSGVHGSLLIHGRPWQGARCVAGQIGHTISPQALGLTCTCGKESHVEAVASGPAIRAEYERRGGGHLPTGQGVIFAAERGEPVALETVAFCAAALGTTVGALANVVDCEIAVIGGPVPEAGPCWWAPMEEALRATLIEELTGLPVRRAELGHEAALVGAARLAWDTAERAARQATYSGTSPTPRPREWL